jgi:hypothetical protein
MTTPSTDVLDRELQLDRFTDLVQRLSRQSVVKHFDAYADIPWDDPGYAIDPADPRWELSSDSPLGGTAWYREQPAEVRSRLGLHLAASNMKAGLQFESVLKRGLLEYAFGLPDGVPEFRYVYHEVIEEAQHSLMFQEFVNRAGLPTPGLTWDIKVASRFVVRLGRRSPAMFFVFVLGGEDPIDHVQRRMLRERDDLPPILERIMRIHVTEEARHLSFARAYLRSTVPDLPWRTRQVMALRAPLILGQMAAIMLKVPPPIVREYQIPKGTLVEAFGPGSTGRQEARDAVRKVRKLLVELGLVTRASRPIWKRFDIWDD